MDTDKDKMCRQCLSLKNCGVLAFQHTLGGKWKTSILWSIHRSGTVRFSDLRRSLEGITEAMLTKQLRELEKDGFICRKVYPEVPPRVEYSVSELGEKTIPLLDAINRWGNDNLLARLYHGTDAAET